MAVIARHARISGHVQGVFFRAWTQQQAEELNVAGWVRNCRDGRVEAHVEGEEEAVIDLIERLRRGPPAARVDDLNLSDVKPLDCSGFEVRH